MLLLLAIYMLRALVICYTHVPVYAICIWLSTGLLSLGFMPYSCLAYCDLNKSLFFLKQRTWLVYFLLVAYKATTPGTCVVLV